MKDESQHDDDDDEEEEVIDRFSSLSDHELQDSFVEGDDSDAQLDHSLINSLSASREKFPTSKYCPHFSIVSKCRIEIRSDHLKRWLREHRRHPYPTNQEKLELAQQSSITYDQVNTWFNNARAILRRRQAKLRNSFDTAGQDEPADRSEPISFQEQPARVDSKGSARSKTEPVTIFSSFRSVSIFFQFIDRCRCSTASVVDRSESNVIRRPSLRARA